MTIATFSGYCVGVLVTYINPFMQDAGYGNLQGKVGFVYGSFSIAAMIWVLLFLPELKGRSLEELDELFADKVSVWRFKKHQTQGWGAQMRELEAESHIDGKLQRLDGVDVQNVYEEPKGKA